MLPFEQQYLNLLSSLISLPPVRKTRTGVCSSSIFGYHLKFPIFPDFPLLTTKSVFFRGIVEELLWMLRGDTCVKSLKKKNVHIWDEWELQDGTIGYGYGHQMRGFNANSSVQKEDGSLFPKHGGSKLFDDGVDQVANLVKNIKEDPASRRLLIINYNPAQAKHSSLPPCHVMAQWGVYGNKLHCKFDMRSSDVFLGLPFNMASYALFTYLLAKTSNLVPGELTVGLADAHLYSNHREAAKLQLERVVKSLPQLTVKTNREAVWDYVYEDLELTNYNPHPALKADVAV